MEYKKALPAKLKLFEDFIGEKPFPVGQKVTLHTETGRPSSWLPWSSPMTLKFAFNISSDDKRGHPDDFPFQCITKGNPNWLNTILVNELRR